MKHKFITLLTICLFAIAIPVTASAASLQSDDNLYAPCSDFEELCTDYMIAIEEGNVEKQQHLEEIVSDALHEEMEMIPTVDERKLRIDQDAAYWLQQFPKYVSYGSFQQNSEGWNLYIGIILGIFSWVIPFASFRLKKHTVACCISSYIAAAVSLLTVLYYLAAEVVANDYAAISDTIFAFCFVCTVYIIITSIINIIILKINDTFTKNKNYYT